MALLLSSTLVVSPFAFAQDAAIDPADAAFMQRLVDREVVKSVAANAKAITVRGRDPLVGADDQTLIDVATVVLRIHAPTGATRVAFLNPKGDEFASFTTAGGLSRTASK
jgi:hypothetical protein